MVVIVFWRISRKKGTGKVSAEVEGLEPQRFIKPYVFTVKVCGYKYGLRSSY